MKPDPKPRIQVRVTPEELAIIDAAAAADERSREAWIRRTLLLAAKAVLEAK